MFRVVMLVLMFLAVACGGDSATPDAAVRADVPGLEVLAADTAMDTSVNDAPPGDIAPSTCTSNSQCDDRIDCTDDMCTSGGCTHVPVTSRCTGGAICDPRQGCQTMRSCGSDVDCLMEASGVVCIGGMCRCPSGGIVCVNRCVDPMTDRYNCGRCDERCGDGQECQAGTCVCTGGRTRCPDVVPQMCMDLTSDPQHCGICGRQCVFGPDDFTAESCLSGHCVIRHCPITCDPMNAFCLQRDARNCGACGTACRIDQVCTDARCACPRDHAECAGRCADTRTDVMNCGACGTRCGDLETCSGGRCVSTCSAGITRCDGVPVCLDNPMHCGRCGNRCAAGQRCVRGVCGT